jgi:hypothetical protein
MSVVGNAIFLLHGERKELGCTVISKPWQDQCPMKRFGIAIFVLFVLVRISTSQAVQTNAKPRVYLQAASKGNNQNAARDQAMEMSKDVERDCPGVRVTINQQNADYTVLLNHIEVGLFIRDNQFQLADRNGDLLTRTKEGGSIRNGMKKVCAQILDDWIKNQPPIALGPATREPPEGSIETSTTPLSKAGQPVSPSQVVLPSKSEAILSTAPVSISDHEVFTAPTSQSLGFRDVTIGAFFEGNPEVRRNGVTVTATTPGGPAEQAGLKAGDVVTAINDHYLYTIRELMQEITRYEPGTRIRIRYRRYSETDEATVTVRRTQ